MEKILTGMFALLFAGISIANAQSTKKVPPPPPPPKKIDVIEKLPPPPPPPKIVIDEVVNPAEPQGPSVIRVKGKMADDFYKRNSSVSDISTKGNIVTIKKKDGAVEKYDMNNKEENKSFTDKYGVSPIPPPPPPPVPPKPKKIS
jgi:hypothetical protein